MHVNHPFSSFWRRAAAALIDLLILGFFLVLIEFVTVKAWQSTFESTYESEAAMYWFVLLIPLLLTWAYTLWFETEAGATPGKKALGIKVTCLDGSQPGWLRLTARWLLHILSLLILGIGFLMPLWTHRRQTLHDLITRTVVIRKG